MIDDQLCCPRRRLRSRVGHQVGYRLILLMADACDHRDGKPGDGPGDTVVVEDEKVRLGAAAANDHHGIISDLAVEDVDKPVHEGLGITVALYGCKILCRLYAVPIRIVLQSMLEILPAG